MGKGKGRKLKPSHRKLESLLCMILNVSVHIKLDVSFAFEEPWHLAEVNV